MAKQETKTSLEAGFLTTWQMLKRAREIPDLPDPETEVRFHPTRKWRFDFAWPAAMVAVEIDGGVHYYDVEKRGRHQRASGIRNDLDKRNAAGVLGWTVLIFCNLHLKDDPCGAIEMVAKLVHDRLTENA